MDVWSRFTHPEKMTLLLVIIQAVLMFGSGLLGHLLTRWKQRGEVVRERAKNLREAYVTWMGFYYEFLMENLHVAELNISIPAAWQNFNSTVRTCHLNETDPDYIRLQKIAKDKEVEGAQTVERIYQLQIKLHESQSRIFLLEDNTTARDEYLALCAPSDGPSDDLVASQRALQVFSNKRRADIKEFCKRQAGRL